DAERTQVAGGSHMQVRDWLARFEARLRPGEMKARGREQVRERGSRRVDADADEFDLRFADDPRRDEPERRGAEVAGHIDVERSQACGALQLDRQSVDSDGRP